MFSMKSRNTWRATTRLTHLGRVPEHSHRAYSASGPVVPPTLAIASKQRTLDVVVILKLDRLTRNVADLGRLLALFEKYHVALAGPDLPFDSSTSVGRLIAKSVDERCPMGARTDCRADPRRAQTQERERASRMHLRP